jgi:ribosome-associated protein
MIEVTDSLAIDESEIQESFVRASGPGGQHVNKAATAVQLRFDVAHSPSLPDSVRDRLMRLAGNRLTEDGVLIIDARRFRSQEQNREDALKRLVDLIRRAARKPNVRRATRPSAASEERRLRSKQRRSQVKRLRKSPKEDGHLG